MANLEMLNFWCNCGFYMQKPSKKTIKVNEKNLNLTLTRENSKSKLNQKLVLVFSAQWNFPKKRRKQQSFKGFIKCENSFCWVGGGWIYDQKCENTKWGNSGTTRSAPNLQCARTRMVVDEKQKQSFRVNLKFKYFFKFLLSLFKNVFSEIFFYLPNCDCISPSGCNDQLAHIHTNI